MVDFINKTVWVMANPISIGLVILLAALCLDRLRRLRIACLILALLWFYFWSTRMATYTIGCPLESDYLVDGRMPTAESYPSADAILDFGGGIGFNTNITSYAELSQSADRAYFSAKLWQAGKAPVIIPSGAGMENGDAKFLLDFGVPRSVLKIENQAVNTEENARRCQELLGEGKRVLLVTSAWHMKRSLLMMRKFAPGLKVVPAPCDFEATLATAEKFDIRWFKPEPSLFDFNSVYFHEWLGYWGYKIFR